MTTEDDTLIDLSEDFEEKLADSAFNDLGTWIDGQLERGMGFFSLVGILELQKQALLTSMLDLEEEL
jgi:hypothetical protein|tara:strand:- start:81 stop:281 length:201 start_codon:yes stop_codon:yes gene_type:complete